MMYQCVKQIPHLTCGKQYKELRDKPDAYRVNIINDDGDHLSLPRTGNFKCILPSEMKALNDGHHDETWAKSSYQNPTLPRENNAVPTVNNHKRRREIEADREMERIMKEFQL